MAENVTTGVFTEQLHITANIDDLKRKLKDAKREWDDFKAGLGNDAGAVFQGSAIGDLAKSIQATSKTLRDLSNEVLSNNALLTRKLTDFAKDQTRVVEAENAKQVASAKKKAEATIALSKNAVYGPSLQQLGVNSEDVPKVYRDLAIEQEGFLEKEAINRRKANEKSIAETVAYNKTKASIHNKSVKEMDDVEYAIQEENKRRQEAADRAELKRYADSRKRAEAAANAKINAAREAEKALATTQAERDKIEYARDAANRKAIIALGKLRDSRSNELFKSELLQADSLADKLTLINERLRTLRSRQASLSGIESSRAASGDIVGQQRAASALLTVEKQITAALGQQASVRRRIIAAIDTASASSKEQLTQQKRVTAEASKAGGFFDKLTDGERWTSTLAHLMRFYLLWNGVQGVIWAVGEAIKVPFQLLGVGVKYLQDTERAADDLVGVIATNMKFSDNYAENFKIAQRASVAVTEALQEQAILTGFSTDALEKTFSALAESGATKYVKTLKEMVELTTDFQMALKAAGAGGMAAQTSVQEMFKLFSGNPGKDNKFLAWLGVNPTEWKAMRDASVETHDLVVRISEKSVNFRDALIEAGKGQVVIINNLKLLFSKIAGEGTKPLFAEITKALLDINNWFKTNRERVLDYMNKLSLGATEILNQLKDAFSDDSFLDSLISAFLRIELIIADAVKPLAQIITDLKEIGEKGIVRGVGAQMRRRAEYADIESQFRDEAAQELSKTDAWKRAPYGAAFFDAVASLTRKKMEAFRQATLHDPKVEKEYKSDAAFGGNETSTERDARIEAEVARLRAERKARAVKSVLDDPFRSGVNRTGVEDILAKINADTQKAEEQYRLATERIKQDIERRVDILEDSKAAGKESTETFAAKALGLSEEEQSRLQVEFEKLIKNLTVIKGRIGALGGQDENRLEAAAEQAANNISKHEREREREVYRASRNNIKNQLSVTKEIESIRVAQSTFEITLLKNKLAEEEQLIQTYSQAGFLTELEAFDELQAAKNAGYELDKRQREINLENAGKDAVERASILRGIEEANKANTARQSVSAAQRLAIVEKERLANIELANILAQQRLQIDEAAVNRASILNPTKNLLDMERALLELKREALGVREREAALELALATRDSGGADTERVRRARSAVGAIKVEVVNLDNTKLANELAGMSGPLAEIRRRRLGGEGAGLSDSLLGKNFADEWGKTTGYVAKFGLGLVGAATALGNFKNIISTIRQGYQEGGVLGGVGAAASSAGGIMGLFKGDSGFGKILGQLGPYAQAAGAVLSIIGGLFTASAKRIADDIKKSMDGAITSFNRGQATLVDTIANVERLRTDAIVRLSGKKGGQDELNKLLPSLEDQLYSLKKQQEDIIKTFDDSLDALRLNSTTLTDIKRKWQDINEQVKNYLGAGGDAAKAAELLSLELGKMRAEAVSDLNNAEQEAIKSITKLNDLLDQRNKLVDDFKKKEFDLISADSLERRQAGSVLRGKELAELRKAHEKALDDIDSEINMTQVRVSKEQEVFKLVNDTAALKRRDEELTLIALDAQIQKWKDLQAIVAGITLGPSGYIGSGVTAPVNITVNVAAPPSGDYGGWARSIGSDIADAYMERIRTVPA